MRKVIKKFRGKIGSLKRVRNETSDYIDEGVDEKVRKMRNYGYGVARDGRIRFEVTVHGDYGEENLF